MNSDDCKATKIFEMIILRLSKFEFIFFKFKFQFNSKIKHDVILNITINYSNNLHKNHHKSKTLFNVSQNFHKKIY